jgi:hypothetical protein
VTPHQRQVLEHDLLLQGFAGRRHHHAPSAEQRGHKIGERLAGARARLAQQNAILVEGALYRMGHVELPLAVLVARHGLR